MSLLPLSTYAGPSQAEALWAVAGSVGPGGGVTQLVAGSGITLDPSTGEGVVTINATGGGGGGGVSSVTASGAGITATPTSGAVVVANTGVTSMVAGSGITLSGATGAVTVSSSVVPTFSGYQNYQYTLGAGAILLNVTGTCGRILIGAPDTPGSTVFVTGPAGSTGWVLNGFLYLVSPSFNANTRLLFPNFNGAAVFNGVTTLQGNWNAEAIYQQYGASPAQSGMRIFISGAGAIPSTTIAGNQWYIDFAVIQLNP